MRNTIAFFTTALLLLGLSGCSNDEGAAPAEISITSLSPEAGTVGTEVNILGTGFPQDPSEIELTFGEVPAPVLSVSNTRIVTNVPEGAASGEVRVRSGGVTAAAPVPFTVQSERVSATYRNLWAPQTGGQGEPVGGSFTRFSFETGEITESDTEWDIAFRGTTIVVNGGTTTGTADEPSRNGNAGAVLVTGIFDEIGSASGLSFTQDSEGAFAIPSGSGNGWYNYNPATFTVTPIPGRVLVMRTHDGKFAKVEILSYYRDAPAEPNPMVDESRVYTFRYVYNPNDGDTTLN